MGLLSYLVFFAVVASIFAVATLGLNLQWGTAGVFNAGVVGFYAVGAYAYAILTAAPKAGLAGNFGLPWLVGLVGAMAVSAVVALLIGLATMRLRGDFLAIATFGVAVTIQLVALNSAPLTGGSIGISSIARPFQDVFETTLGYNAAYLALVLAVVALIYWAIERIVRSPWGRVLKAIREDEIAAVNLGKDARLFRLQSFVLGSMIIGLAGALYVGYVGFVSPSDFMPILTFQIWTMLIVGGSGNNRGAIVGAFVVWGIWTAIGALASKLLPVDLQTQGGALQSLVVGLILVLVLILRPRGLVGELAVVSRHLERPGSQAEAAVRSAVL